NTVTVQVNGTKIGTEYHAAWSPDITLDKSNAPVYTDDEVRTIVTTCPASLLVDITNAGSWKVYAVGGTQPAAAMECGTDPSTSVNPRVNVGVTETLTAAKARWSANNNGSGWGRGRAGTLSTSTDRHFTLGSESKQNLMYYISGGAKIAGIILSYGEPGISRPGSSADPTDPEAFNVAGMLELANGTLLAKTDYITVLEDVTSSGTYNGNKYTSYAAETFAKVIMRANTVCYEAGNCKVTSPKFNATLSRSNNGFIKASYAAMAAYRPGDFSGVIASVAAQRDIIALTMAAVTFPGDGSQTEVTVANYDLTLTKGGSGFMVGSDGIVGWVRFN
ncbi:hypothetical protein DPX58_26765, partial [Salmonella enterica]|nr:hypothetical protein [Salmonella enterica]EBR8649398.1 hypothetical protein [Salmonella enterica subsp. enterica serovar Muenchen]EBM1353419.1 hypothetical protein [Salmonella enterica]EBM3133651.1 hypothetical protein [Salmonella enterica]ECS8394123.1 hypothetical protein [Salmonella enterica subsp. enterica serovar Muenchen]